MVVLKQFKNIRLKASTLVETLVASVIIIVIFTIASLTLNNIFSSNIKGNLNNVENHLNKLEYLYHNNKIKYPYQEDFEDWDIQLVSSKENEVSYIFFKATRSNSKKIIYRKIDYVASE